MITNVILFAGLGEYCLFVYGNELKDKPLITQNLPDGPVITVLKIAFSVNVIISISLCAYPANTIMESYLYSKMKDSLKKTWLINVQRTFLIGLAIILCISLKNSIDKFNSVIGTVTATPVVFIIPCLAFYKICGPSKMEKGACIGIILFALVVLFYCTGFTISTWNY